MDRDLHDFKLQVPTFQAKNDPKAYLEWEQKFDRIFSYHNYSKEKKFKLVTLEFTKYASVWWDQLVALIERDGTHWSPHRES